MHKSLSILITFCLSTFNYSQWDEIYSKNLIAEHFYQSISTVFWSIWITCFKMSPSDISSWNFMKSISHLSHLGHGSPTRRIIDYSSHAGEIIRFFYWCHTNLLFKSWTDKIWSKSDFKISISCLNWDWGKVKKMRRRQGSGFENLLDHLFSFYSLLQVLKRKWEEDEEAALMNAKCLFPSNSLWWWILCPKDRSFSAIQIPLRP